MQFSADSDAIITKGIIGLLIQVLNNESPETVLKSDLFFISQIGLAEHLSPTRANGLLSMVKRMKTEALQSLTQ
jgi:cysteine desulfuration protein SufE